MALQLKIAAMDLHRVVGPLQCPQTYDLMYVMVDSTGRNITPLRPPGYVDPHDIGVHSYQRLGSDSLSLVAVEHPGTRNRHYECAARREARGLWRAHCDNKGMSISAVPPAAYELATLDVLAM